MDQGTNGVGLRGRGGHAKAEEIEGTEETAEEVAERLEQKAHALRENLSGLVSELDHRRRGVRWHVVKPVAVVAGVAALALGVAAAVAWRRARRARRRAARRARAR